MTTALQTAPFADLLETSRAHREEHGCGAYPYDKGALLQVVAASVNPDRIVEVGTALGYTSICMAYAAPNAQIDTIDMDPLHVELARAHFDQNGMNDRIVAHIGDANDVLPNLKRGLYDLAFFDGFAPTQSVIGELHRLLRSGGTLVCANMTLGGDGGAALSDDQAWISYSLGETALAVKR